MNMISYILVSTEKQLDGHGLDVQEQARGPNSLVTAADGPTAYVRRVGDPCRRSGARATLRRQGRSAADVSCRHTVAGPVNACGPWPSDK
jgi:hypothetical protein